MRVALLTWFYPPGGSGLGRAAHMIAHGLCEAGCSVVVISASLPLGVRHCDADVEVVGCAPLDEGMVSFLRRRACIGHLVGTWYFRKVLRELHRETPFDIVEATNWYAPAALLGKTDPPTVIRNSTPAIDIWASTKGLRNRLDLRFAHAMEKRTAKCASALISNTPTHHHVIEQIYGSDQAVSHSVVELALDPTLIAKSGAAAAPSAEKPSLLFVGRDERRKGFREVLGAFARIAAIRHWDDQPPIGLIVVGVDKAIVRKALSGNASAEPTCEHISCFANVSDETLHELYEEATIVVAPSRYESYGLVYREAAAFGRPLVACAEDPAAAQFIERAQCGVLADNCSPSAIQNAIETLLADDELRLRLGENGRAHAKTLTRLRLGDETLQVYRNVLANQRPVEQTDASKSLAS